MRYAAAIASVILLGLAGGKATAQPPVNLPKLDAPRVIGRYPSPPVVPVNLSSTIDTRGQIAACANLAAIRGVNARTSGADYATQNRVLELTFLVCMSGKPFAG